MLEVLTSLDSAALRQGDWMQASDGSQFWPMDPRPSEIDIHVIAHALSMLCRYGGHCQRFYSVAEHCVLMSREVSEKNKLWALLHDASEAYLVDVPRPIKPFLVGYKEAEARIMDAVCAKFGLTPEMPAEVHAADNAILNDERAQNMVPTPHVWKIDPTPLGVQLQFWSPEEARRRFLQQFRLAQRLVA